MPFSTRAFVLVGAVFAFAGSAQADSLTLAQGEARREPVAGTVANVVVVDPTVADATVIDQHSIVVLAKGLGVTEILATDHAGHVLIDDRVVVAAPAEDGRVTVYRGATGADYACLPRCHALEASGGASGPTNGAGGEAGYQPPPPVTVASTVSPPVMVNQAGSAHP